jgi:CheY-like chemotaxis protein
MTRATADMLPARILVVDDERQIHASLRLRLGQAYDLSFCFGAREALKSLANERFDLCFADIHMPHMDGLAFIEAAEKIDRHLGFVLLSAFDSDENLRRAIPLQVYDFIGKPLPERDGFEARIPDWIERTRRRREEHLLAEQAGVISRDLDSARLEREVELVASESARDALLQTSGLLTTIHAHLVSATSYLGARVRADSSFAQLLRGLDEARKTADAAVNVAEAFFGSGYGNRDSSPAMVGAGLQHAISIASRMTKAGEGGKIVDHPIFDDRLPVRGLSGIDFLLMAVPAIELALKMAAPNTTLRIVCEPLARLELAMNDGRFRTHFWINRRNALISQPGTLISITGGAASPTRAEIEAWLRGEDTPVASAPARGLIAGLQKCKGLLAVAVIPHPQPFRLLLVLPT